MRIRDLLVVAWLLCTGVEAAPPMLTARDVGEYAGVPWDDRADPITPGTRADRTRDLNLSIASVRLADAMTDDAIRVWSTKSRPGSHLILRLHFWDGVDRHKGPMLPIDVYWNRIDRFLSLTDLSRIDGITLSEENVPYLGRWEVLAELYRRTKAKYDVTIWQWWSPPSNQNADKGAHPQSPGESKAVGNLPADGWIFNPYWQPKALCRRTFQRFLLAGKPVILMPWASDLRPWTAEQDQITRDQLDLAVEFNVPVCWYWTKKTLTGGSSVHFGGDRESSATDIDKYNRLVWSHSDRVRGLPVGFDVLPSADLSEGTPIANLVKVGESLTYSDDFSGSKLIDSASFNRFRDIISDGRGLVIRGHRGRRVSAELVWHVRSPVDVLGARVVLETSTTIANMSRTALELSISSQPDDWNAAVTQRGFAGQTLDPQQPTAITRRDFYVRLRIDGPAGTDDMPAAHLRALTITATP